MSSTELMELQRQANARNGRADSARHARLILQLSEGLTWAEIRAKLDCSDSYIDHWRRGHLSLGQLGVIVLFVHFGAPRCENLLPHKHLRVLDLRLADIRAAP